MTSNDTVHAEFQFERTSVKIPSKTPGWDLDAWRYLPQTKSTPKGLPVVIMQVPISSSSLFITVRAQLSD